MAKRKAKTTVETKPLKLDLGCGTKKLEGFIGVDNRELPGVDVILDFQYWALIKCDPWPWEDDSVDEINCSYLLPYLDQHSRMHFMNECHRILKKGSKLAVTVPHESCMRSIQDPMYQWPTICELSFMYYNAEWRKNEGVSHYPITADFDFTYGYSMDAEMNLRNDEYKQYAIKHYRNAAIDLVVSLIKR